MSNAVVAQSTNFGMGTVMTHRVFGKHAEEALRVVEDEALRLEKILSRFLPGSEISRLNGSAGMKCEKLVWIPMRCYRVLLNSLSMVKDYLMSPSVLW